MRRKGVQVKGTLIAILVVVLLAGSVWAGDRRELSASEKQWLRREARIMARHTRRLRLPEPTHVRAPLARRWRRRSRIRHTVNWREGSRRYLNRIYNGLHAAPFDPVP